MNKICKGSCGKDKDISNFAFRKDTGKYRNQCMDCINKKALELKKIKRWKN